MIIIFQNHRQEAYEASLFYSQCGNSLLSKSPPLTHPRDPLWPSPLVQSEGCLGDTS